MGNGSILVIGQSKEVINDLPALLGEGRYQTTVVKSAQAAVHHMLKQFIDIVIIDDQLPDIQPDELVQALQVIALSPVVSTILVSDSESSSSLPYTTVPRSTLQSQSTLEIVKTAMELNKGGTEGTREVLITCADRVASRPVLEILAGLGFDPLIVSTSSRLPQAIGSKDLLVFVYGEPGSDNAALADAILSDSRFANAPLIVICDADQADAAEKEFKPRGLTSVLINPVSAQALLDRFHALVQIAQQQTALRTLAAMIQKPDAVQKTVSQPVPIETGQPPYAEMDEKLTIIETQVNELRELVKDDTLPADPPTVAQDTEQSLPDEEDIPVQSSEEVSFEIIDLAKLNPEQLLHLTDYLENFDSEFEKVMSAFNTEDWEQVVFTSNQVAGAAAICGLDIVSDELRRIEDLQYPEQAEKVEQALLHVCALVWQTRELIWSMNEEAQQQSEEVRKIHEQYLLKERVTINSSLVESGPDLIPLIRDFLEEVEDYVTNLENHLKGEEWESLVDLAHEVAGVAGVYGFPKYQEATWNLQQLAQEKEKEGATAVLHEIKEITHAMIKGRKRLEARIDEYDTQSKSELQLS